MLIKMVSCWIHLSKLTGQLAFPALLPSLEGGCVCLCVFCGRETVRFGSVHFSSVHFGMVWFWHVQVIYLIPGSYCVRLLCLL